MGNATAQFSEAFHSLGAQKLLLELLLFGDVARDKHRAGDFPFFIADRGEAVTPDPRRLSSVVAPQGILGVHRRLALERPREGPGIDRDNLAVRQGITQKSRSRQRDGSSIPPGCRNDGR